MGEGKWFRRGRRAKSGNQRGGKAKRRSWLSGAASRCSLGFEMLEDRRLLATFLVTNTNDLDADGNIILGSLRWAVQQANASAGGDTIVFSDNIFSELGESGFNQEQFEQSAELGGGFHTISLSGMDSPNAGALNINQPLEILGPGYKRIIVSQGKADSRVFDINIGAEDVAFPVEISGITIEGGSILGDDDDDKGGGVFNRESLMMREVRITGNSASMGGGGVYTKFGSTRIWRSLIEQNSGGGEGGGGVLNGADGEDNRPTTSIVNSTIHNNFGGQYGGGVLNRNGTLRIDHSTITGNFASDMMTPGSGVASWGNPLPDDPMNPPPPPTVFTSASHSIVFGNLGSDFDRVGMGGDPPMPLLPSVTSRGYNFVGTGNTTMAGPDLAFSAATNDMVGVDPMLMEFGNFGGSVDTYLLDPLSPAIDAGDPMFFPSGFQGTAFDARGRHFNRIFDYTLSGMPVVDVGATEMQSGVFVVDTLVDEFDYSFVELFTVEIIQGQSIFFFFDYGDFEGVTFSEPGMQPPGSRLGDLSLREALDFAARNPGKDTIQFSPVLNELESLELEDPDPSPAPTIILNRAITLTKPFGQDDPSPHRPLEGSLKVRASELMTPPPDDGHVDIEGPLGFILEIDGSGNDLNPNAASGGGSRVFMLDDLDSMTQLEISMSNLTLMGGDTFGDGGGVFNRENLTLRGMTLKNNNATDDGGAFFIADGTVIVDSSTFNNNRAGDNGGAIDVSSGGDLTITNSTFSANVANNRGGAIYNENSHVIVDFSTITLNSAGALRGSGIANQNTNATANVQTEVRGSIISDNVGDADVDFIATATNSATAASFISHGYNFIGKGNAKVSFNQMGDQIDQVEPLLESLLNTGGLVETHRPVYNPSAGLISPVIDAGDPAATGAPMFDQRGEGFDRVKDGDFDGTARIDIGSYELQGITLIVSNNFDENDGVVSAGNLSLREAIDLANRNPFPDEINFDPAMIAFLAMIQNNDPTLFLGDSILAPGSTADLRITGTLIIDTLGQQLAIDGELLDNPSLTINGSRIFTVDDGNPNFHSEVIIRGLEFRNARAPQAGGVFWSNENLTIEDSRFVNNWTRDEEEVLTGLHGGAIYQQGVPGSLNKPVLTIVRNEFTANKTLDVNADGGAIYVTDANFILEDSNLAGNSTTEANSEGGGIAIRNGDFSASFSSITGNFTTGGLADGGGFFAEASSVTLNDTNVSGNETLGSGSDGAGFAGRNSAVTLNNSSVTFNTAQGSQGLGGGVYMLQSGGASALVLNQSQVLQNHSKGINAMGGGIAVSGGSAVLNESTVASNRVTNTGSHGAGIANLGGAVTLRDSTVSGNIAEYALSRGGGVYSDTALGGGSVTLILNSTVSGNSAGHRGGGVYNADGRTDVKHSTITNNAVSTINSGSGVASLGNSGTTLTTVQSSIIAGNVGAGGGTRTDVDSVDANFQNTFQSLGYNVIGTGNALVAFDLPPDPPTLPLGIPDKENETNPGLSPLADNGGPTLTHALLDGSPAINAGSPSFNPNSFSPPLTMDQVGNPRVRQGRIDAGAFESNLVPALPADFNSDSVVDGSDFLTWQRNVGASPASKAQGDADGNNVVNGADLTEWRIGFGGGGAPAVVASASSSSAALLAGEDHSASFVSAAGDLSFLASQGAPGMSVNGVEQAENPIGKDEFVRAEAVGSSLADRTWAASNGWSLLRNGDVSDIDLLAENVEDTLAEDEVFGAWGEEPLF